MLSTRRWLIAVAGGFVASRRRRHAGGGAEMAAARGEIHRAARAA